MRLSTKLIAEVCHEANRVLQKDLGEDVSPPWDEASDEMRYSIINGVENALCGASPQGSHENWLRFKAEHGWVYGPVKDEMKKTHPCMLAYRDLPETQKFKDKLFTGIVAVFKQPI
jgi:hypothetical protein